VAIAGYFINYVTETRGETSSALGAKFLAIAQGCFAIGRFSGSGMPPIAMSFDAPTNVRTAIMRYIKPRKIFLIYLSGAVVFCAASITQRGNVGLAMLNVTLFFESICFPTIVALGIRGIGKHTKVCFRLAYRW
jgi:FHS family L-fucose permease-like MFS transporter